MKKNIGLYITIAGLAISVVINFVQVFAMQRERAVAESQHEILLFKQQELEKCRGK